MIKQIVDFVKDLFSSKETEPVAREAPTLNPEATWPFPTARPDNQVPVLQPVVNEEAPKSAPVKKRPVKKKRPMVKTAAPAPVVNAVPSKEDIKSSKKKNPPKKKK